MALNRIRTGPAGAETVVLLHPVGLDLTYWDRQIEALRPRYAVVAFDLPGHGRSPGTAGQWSFAYATDIVAQVVREVSTSPVHLAGISFGSMIAQAAALAWPELVRSLTLIGTASRFADPARAAMHARAEAVRGGGMQAVLPSTLARWFTPETLRDRPELIDRVSKTLLADDPAVHAAIWEIISGFDVLDRLGEIRCPTLVLVGEEDASTPPSAAAAVVERVAGARLVVVPGASHMTMLEAPDAVNAAMLRFLR